jgi:TrmH family RNA methyltransferase
MTITSPHNEKLKEIRKLHQRRGRDRAGRFVAEGEDLLAAADAAGWTALERYCAAGSGLIGVEVEPRVLASASALGSGTRALAVYAERWAPAPPGPLCVYLYGVSDPGNVGAVLRSAQAFGASSVALGPGSADPFGPKAVRASMGAVFSVPVARADDLAALPGQTIALVAGAGDPLSELMALLGGEGGPLSELMGLLGGEGSPPSELMGLLGGEGGPPSELWRSATTPRSQSAKVQHPAGAKALTLLVGSERDGLPDELVAAADQVAHIPIQTHSLNAAMAATVALYEVTRMAAG